MELTYTKNGWQQTTQKNLNYKPEGGRNIGRKITNEMGRWLPGGRNRPRGLSLIVDDDDDDNDDDEKSDKRVI